MVPTYSEAVERWREHRAMVQAVRGLTYPIICMHKNASENVAQHIAFHTSQLLEPVLTVTVQFPLVLSLVALALPKAQIS